MVLLLLIYKIKELLWHTLLHHLQSPHGEKSTLKQEKKRAYFVSIGNFVTFLGKNFYTWIS